MDEPPVAKPPKTMSLPEQAEAAGLTLPALQGTRGAMPQTLDPKLVVPRFLHQIWWQGANKIPQKFEPVRGSWLKEHPHWFYRLWDELSLQGLLHQHYQMLIPTYMRLEHMIQKIHFFQYLLLFHFGGVVAQVDILCNREIESSVSGSWLVLCAKYDACKQRGGAIESSLVQTQHDGAIRGLWRETVSDMVQQVTLAVPACFSVRRKKPYLSMAVMASIPRHIFWQMVLRNMILEASESRKFAELFENYVHRTTGSKLLSKTFSEASPANCRVLPRSFLDPRPYLCTAKCLTMSPGKVFASQLTKDEGRTTYSKDPRRTSDGRHGLTGGTNTAVTDKRKNRQQIVLVDQHCHSWKKTTVAIVPILLFVGFLVAAAVVVKLVILRKSNPITEKERRDAHVQALVSGILDDT